MNDPKSEPADERRRIRWQIAKDTLTLAGGVALVLVAYGIVSHIGGNPLHELALIRGAQVAVGSLVETRDVEREDDRGHVYFSDDGVYAFRLPDGREFMTITNAPVGQLAEHVDVEYLPGNPAVNRVKGDGGRSITDWLFRRCVLGLLLMASFSIPGIAVIRYAIRDIRVQRRMSKLCSSAMDMRTSRQKTS